MQGIQERLQCRAPPDFVSAGGFFQLKAHQPGNRRPFVAVILVHVQGGDKRRADYRNRQPEPEPEQNFGEK